MGAWIAGPFFFGGGGSSTGAGGATRVSESASRMRAGFGGEGGESILEHGTVCVSCSPPDVA